MTYQDLRALLTKRFHIPRLSRAEKAVRRFTLAEKALFYFFAILFVLSCVLLVSRVNASFLTSVPLSGGTLSEGMMGNPRFINPVLALSEADKALVSLVYSGLMRATPEGSLAPDLAERVDVSNDGLVYTAVLREGATFHDGSPVTADDVVFTIQKIQDPGVKSPLFGDFAGVNVTKTDSRTVTFTLRRPYAPFIWSLTVGILPKHVWSSVGGDEFSFSQWNVLPVGSGPYEVRTVTRDSGGIPDYYELEPFERDTSGVPYIEKYVFKFYPTESELLEAYDSGDVEAISGISPAEAKLLAEDGAKVLASPLPRVFGVFFNQNMNKALLQKEVRQALDLAAPKQKIVDEVLSGYGTVLEGPLPPGLLDYDEAEHNHSHIDSERLEEAKALLEARGWTKNEETGVLEKKSKDATLSLTLSLSTSDNPELKAVATMLAAAWSELGARVELLVYESGDLNQNVIRPRRYDALLFGEVVGREADVYPFWHSSEKSDPGLNIAVYVSSEADRLLAETRSSTDALKREEAYAAFDQAVRNDAPAVFLYSPSFIYVVPKDVKDITLAKLGTPRDRFSGIRDWYIETSSVWNIFAKTP